MKLLARANEIIEMEARPSRAEAYQAAGRYILEQSELLITIWDGKQARGRGGTGQIVSEAPARVADRMVEDKRSSNTCDGRCG